MAWVRGVHGMLRRVGASNIDPKLAGFVRDSKTLNIVVRIVADTIVEDVNSRRNEFECVDAEM